MSNKKSEYSPTAYDDAFKTLQQECDDALIGFINHVFGEKYDNTVKIIRLGTEQHIEHDGKRDETRHADMYLSIIQGTIEKGYLLECESRLFQYGIQSAIFEKETTHSRMILRFPNMGLLVLKDKGAPPNKVTIEIHAPEGAEGRQNSANVMSFDALVIRESDYSLDDLFEKKLYFLIPFYFFNIEEQMAEYDTDEEKLKQFEKTYCSVIEKLEKVPEDILSLRSKGVIIKQMGSVTGKLSEKYRNINEKVGDIMGGKVVKMEWLERFDAAVADGEARGDEKRLIRQICCKLRKGKGIRQIADELEEDEIRIKVICDAAEKFKPDYDENRVIEAIRQGSIA